MAGPQGSPPPEHDPPRESPTELRGELRITRAKCERAVAQRDYYLRSLEKLRAEFEKTRDELAALRAAGAESCARNGPVAREPFGLHVERDADRAILESLRKQMTGLPAAGKPSHSRGPSGDGAIASRRVGLDWSTATQVQESKSMDSMTHKANPRGARIRMGWHKWAAVICAGLLIVVAGLLVALTRRPSWYHPAPVDRERLHADKAALVSLEDEVSAALNSGQEIRFRLDEEQINRWLAARAEMWPEAALELGSLQNPQVSLAEGEIRIGATAARGSLRTVVALICHVDVGNEHVSVQYGGPHVGVIPVPGGWISDVLSGLTASSHGAIQADSPGTVTLENDWVWPNGKRRCRLRELHVSAGEVEVVLQPLSTGRR